MIPFQSVTPADKALLSSYILPGEYRDNNLSVCNLCSWHFASESSFTVLNRQLLIRFRTREGSPIYSLPFGEGDKAEIFRLLQEEARQQNEPLLFFGPPSLLKNELEKYTGLPFEYTCPREHFDYLYYRKDLAELKGKNYQPKRNHANRFRKKYPYCYQTLTPDILPHCLELAERWCMEHKCEESRELQYEQQAMKFALEHFEILGLTGGALWVENEIVAFTYGAPVNYDTFCVHIEKADTNFDGAYAVINQEFASRVEKHYIYLNREEDLGIPGLRKAKLSYYPVILLEKCRASFR